MAPPMTPTGPTKAITPRRPVAHTGPRSAATRDLAAPATRPGSAGAVCGGLSPDLRTRLAPLSLPPHVSLVVPQRDPPRCRLRRLEPRPDPGIRARRCGRERHGRHRPAHRPCAAAGCTEPRGPCAAARAACAAARLMLARMGSRRERHRRGLSGCARALLGQPWQPAYGRSGAPAS